MATDALPSARELADRVRTAMDATEWSPRQGDRTRRLKQRVWELGFDIASEYGVPLYPFAGLGPRLDDHARGRLEARSAHFWPYPEEQSTLKEWAYDVAWAKFGAEYQAHSDDRHTPERVPSFGAWCSPSRANSIPAGPDGMCSPTSTSCFAPGPTCA